MELPIHRFQLLKAGVHVAQLVFILAAWVLCILVFKSKAHTDGRLGWYFGLCFLTLLPIVYLTMTPRFPRTRKFANPLAMAVVDLLFALLWLTAFASVASWSHAGRCKDACGKSQGVIGLGVFIWLLFVLTTAMSVYAFLFHRREGHLPGTSRIPSNAAMIDPDKEAFSTAPGGDEYAPVHGHDEHDRFDEAGHHGGSLGRHDANSYGGAFAAPNMDHDTGYAGYGGMGSGGGGGGDHGRVQFPRGNYSA